uniref:Ubiquitin-like protease family profile domain-containing protein n=1 Tax=Panagrolaimus sp. ES5 TaxID=591445 RepID=A0AC34G9A4_9BILA
MNSDVNKLSKEQLKGLIPGLDVAALKAQQPNQVLQGDGLSVMLANLVATSNEKVLALSTLFGGIHYSSTHRNPKKILASNHLIGKPYRDDYEYLIIPVIDYYKKTLTAKEMTNSIGHWLIAIYFRQRNLILYIDPYGGERITSVPAH